MSKVVTLRLSDEEYAKIAATAKIEHRPISNFITTATLKEIEDSYYTDVIETDQIASDKKLLKKLKKGHQDANKMRGKMVG